ncbi:VanZ family protein [Bifidobacterium thermophilum]|uniref:VanZ family protein n=1 Tax=Bifidobacterium thermophilum TaxID=33905 RepID=UPI003F8D90DB
MSIVTLYAKTFGTPLLIALLLWPILAAFLTLPILALLYHREHRLRLASTIGSYLSVLYVVGLLTFTQYPMPDEPDRYCAAHHLSPQLNPLEFIQDIATGGVSAVMQLLLNIVLFMPLGFLLMRFLRRSMTHVVVVGFLLSLTIELTQLSGFWGIYPCSYRQFDVDDLLTNTLGALVGYGIAKLCDRRWPPKPVDRTEINHRPGIVHRGVTFAIDMIMVILGYYPLGIIVVWLFHAIAKPLPAGTFQMASAVIHVESLNTIVTVLGMASFLIFELWIPATHRGQTLGGMFTHMSMETRERHGWQRVLFYTIRTTIIGGWFLLTLLQKDTHSGLLIIAVAVFALIFKQMPWDYVPGDAESERADADGVGDASDAGDAEDAGDADGAAVTALTENVVNAPASPISQNRQ